MGTIFGSEFVWGFIKENIWVFPKIGIPPNHPFIILRYLKYIKDFPLETPSSYWGSPMTMETPILHIENKILWLPGLTRNRLLWTTRLLGLLEGHTTEIET